MSNQQWQKLSGFNGNSQPSTFALTVASRLYEDFSRKRFGRPRPPSWLQALGQGWVKLWRMMCLERQWPEVIQSQLTPLIDPVNLKNMMATISQRLPNCGAAGFSECSISELGLDEGTHLEDMNHAPYHSLDASLNQHILNATYQSLHTLMNASQQSNVLNCPSNEAGALTALNDACHLTEDDRLLLALPFEDGLSSRKVAQLTGQSPSQVQRKISVIKKNLKSVLSEWGIDTTMLHQELNHDA